MFLGRYEMSLKRAKKFKTEWNFPYGTGKSGRVYLIVKYLLITANVVESALYLILTLHIPTLLGLSH